MAIKSTIFKVELQLSDLDRNYYHTHVLTIARHPSETDERMMLRLLVFSFHASETLLFTKGISNDNVPDLWQKNLSGEIELWVELGQPDEKRIRKAYGRAQRVCIYTYQHRSAIIWWEQIKQRLERFENLSIISLQDKSIYKLAGLVNRNMQLQCTIQDGQAWLSDINTTIHIEPVIWKNPDYSSR